MTADDIMRAVSARSDARPDQPEPDKPPGYPPGFYDLTRLTRDPSDGRTNPPSESERAW